MSPWSLKRKIIILSVIFLGIFCFLIIVGIRTFSTEPTCFDGKQNGEERGIDCGGACERVCSSDALSIVTLWQRSFLVTDDVYNAVAYIENQNTSAGIKNIQYRFRIYDENNVIITERTGATFIAPNTRSAIFEPGLIVGNRVPKEVFFEFTEIPFWSYVRPKFGDQPLSVTSQEFINESSSARVLGTIENRTLFDIFDIEVVVVLYDKDGNAINASKTFLNSVSKSGSQDVVFTWPKKFDTVPARIEIIPRINVFSEGNK